MWRELLVALAGAASTLAGGCASTGPLLDNPVLLRPVATAEVENPAYIALGPSNTSYAKVWDTVLDVVDDFWPDQIAEANRYAALIRTHPKIAPGVEQFFKPGSPDFDQRLLATFQTIRHYAVVKIDGVPDHGYWVDVKVYKELEDLARPTRQTAGAAVFRSEPTVERQFEVIEPTTGTAGWIPIGEDVKLEQEILARIKKRL